MAIDNQVDKFKNQNICARFQILTWWRKIYHLRNTVFPLTPFKICTFMRLPRTKIQLINLKYALSLNEENFTITLEYPPHPIVMG